MYQLHSTPKWKIKDWNNLLNLNVKLFAVSVIWNSEWKNSTLKSTILSQDFSAGYFVYNIKCEKENIPQK
jgi:hypothetical protein